MNPVKDAAVFVGLFVTGVAAFYAGVGVVEATPVVAKKAKEKYKKWKNRNGEFISKATPNNDRPSVIDLADCDVQVVRV